MTELQQAEARLSKLIEDMSGSLQTEVGAIQAEVTSLHAEMRDGFERVEAATRRNTRTLAGGAAAIAALNRWADQRDTADRKRDNALHDLDRRLRKVERAVRKRK